jgi:hypothetical protein
LTATNPEDSAISLIQDDALYRVQRAIGLIPPSGLGVARRAVLYTLITWLPIAVWAWLHGHAMAGSLDEPLFRHFGVNVRCLLAIPLLIVADATAHGVSLRLIPQFVRAGIVADDEAFHAVLERARRARSRTLPWVIIAGLVIGWVVLAPSLLQQHDLLWAVDDPATHHIGFGGWWYLYVARPVYVALVLAWLWRLFLLTRFMFYMSRLPLSLVPTHPDRLGGLGFLQAVPGAFALVILALSSVLSAGWAHDVKYHEMSLEALRLPAAGFLVLLLLLFFAPLLVFLPALVQARRAGKLEYAALVALHGRAVRERWINGRPVVDAKALLEAPEIGPVADTISMYDAVARMRPVPVGRVSLMSVLVPAIIPMLVVIALRIPIKDLLLTLLKALT